MTVTSLRVSVPEHQLTIFSAGDDLKAGSCRCGWHALTSKDQDDIGRQFAAHRDTAPAPVVLLCDCCLIRAAAVRHGSVDLCPTCALDELVRHDPRALVALDAVA
jgi:hypothetical protein